MVKVKTFTTGSANILHYEMLDKHINKFLVENDVEVVDIKYSTCAYANQMGGGAWMASAMLIYKEK
ncbi:MAG: sporulation protein Cse60 [Bacteroidales bacterium]|nr:sporulation protein Cse60 [Bacteroidales bacterium]